jgi:hypothetical protein
MLDRKANTDRLVKCREIWRKVLKQKAEGDELVLELMRHPDTTPAQLAECRQSLFGIEKEFAQSLMMLREAYPVRENNFFLQHPWWDEKYNRYEES